jgi:ribonuclease HII
MSRFDPNLLPATPDLEFETSLWLKGLTHIAGIDEAGRGALAGPVAAGIVIFPFDDHLQISMQGLKDSKQLTAAERSKWAARIRETALAWAVAYASNDEIDQLGIVPATQLAAQRALLACKIEVDHLLLDYLFLPEIDIPQTKLVKGDQRSLSIAAASVLAKTSRDALMLDLDGEFPDYQLAINKGYGTQQHRNALMRYGPKRIHRISFAPIKHRLRGEGDRFD